MSDDHREPQPYQLMIIELDDVVPRLNPDKPNLYLAKTVSNPKDRFEVIQRSKKQRWYSSHVLQLRLDLTPSESYATSQEATAAMKELKKELRKDGYTVNRDNKVWSVYVVELDSSAVKNPGEGYVYVGETSRTPEERFEQHKSGARNKHGRLYSTVVNKHGVCLRPDLAPSTKYFDKASAKLAEKEHFELLKSKGFTVKGGH